MSESANEKATIPEGYQGIVTDSNNQQDIVEAGDELNVENNAYNSSQSTGPVKEQLDQELGEYIMHQCASYQMGM